MATIKLGRWAGLDIFLTPSAQIWLPVLWVALTMLVRAANLLPLAEAVIFGGVGMFLHTFGEILHQVGHARAARSTGYPMTGVRLWWLLGASLYPRDEPELPAAVHIRRALGGPIFSAGVLLVAVIITAVFMAIQAPLLLILLAAFFALENLAIYSLGALLPLGFTDGSTLLRYWGQ